MKVRGFGGNGEVVKKDCNSTYDTGVGNRVFISIWLMCFFHQMNLKELREGH